jgi:hypothetical protein
MLSANGEPYGLLARAAASDITTHTIGAAPLLDDLIEMEYLLAGLDADRGTPAWLTSPALRRLLRQTPKAPGEGDLMLWSDANSIPTRRRSRGSLAAPCSCS